MLQFAKKLGGLALLLLGLQNALGYSLIGPNNEAYQVPVIGYNPLPRDPLPIAPKNLGEEYRRNTPIVYYSFDQTFLDYFGSNGVYAVEQAIAIMNSLTNVSQYSADLSEFPMEAERFNFRAQELFLLDLKSETLHALVEQMGLTEPVRYTWTLKDRATIPNSPPCPDGMVYTVIKRNFDPAPAPGQPVPTSYVNGTLYSYVIDEFCTGNPPLAEAVEFPVDIHARIFTPIAEAALDAGGFYTGLTRDDVGGFRYLYSTNNLNVESAGPATVEFVTNTTPSILVTSNLNLLQAQALTNDAATLSALYPGLIITSTSNSFTSLRVTNFFAYFTNSPYDPVEALPHIAFSSNITFVLQTAFHHTFGNLAVVRFSAGHWFLEQVTDISRLTNHAFITVQTSYQTNSSPFATTPSFRTNTVTRTYLTNEVAGEFVILTSNLCDLQIIAPVFTNVVINTNILVSATNSITISNVVITQFFFQSEIDYFTNHAFLTLAVNCPSNTVALRQGIERVRWVRQDFDSLLGRFFQPITNNYLLNEITNSTIFPRNVQRAVNTPDFLFSAADLSGGPNDYPPVTATYARSVNFNTANVLPGLAGPGTIEGAGSGSNIFLTFNKTGPIFLHYRLDPVRFLDELTQIPILTWGSFDGTTNAPIIYPDGQSITDLENQLLFPVSPATLTNGIIGQPYSVQFTPGAGQAPFTWVLAPNSNPLPPGLDLSTDGLLSGTPTTAGTFSFVLRVTDATGRSVDRLYPISITP